MSSRPLRERVRTFCEQDPDPRTRAQLQQWLDRDDEPAMQDAFEPALRFGTAGIRAPMGAGASRMNRATVRRCVAAVCERLVAVDATAGEHGVCIGYDGRHGSATFAKDAAAVVASYGLRVRLFDMPVPTPVLAHATKVHGASAGLMITASHNPPEDNGIKLYWQGGSQVLPPHDAAIADALAAMDRTPDVDTEQSAATVIRLGDGQLSAYLQALLARLPAAEEHAPYPRVTYSALCGVGAGVTRTLLQRLGVTDVHEVAAECRIDPDFADLRSPNPEDPEALKRSLELARSSDSDLLLVHDPDADRLAVGVRHAGEWVVLSGDEVGCLLGDYCLTESPQRPAAVISTLVSSGLLARIAAAHGALWRSVPTGFKWIAEQGRALEAEGTARFVFGYEEAIGYCMPSLSDDKDGVAALGLVVNLWRQAAGQGQSLVSRLHELYAHHGVHRSRQVTWRFGEPKRREHVIEALRSAPPRQLAAGTLASNEGDPRAPELVVLGYDHSLRVALRPSGTEPKLKAYLEVSSPALAPARVAERIEELDALLDQACEQLRGMVDEIGVD